MIFFLSSNHSHVYKKKSPKGDENANIEMLRND